MAKIKIYQFKLQGTGSLNKIKMEDNNTFTILKGSFLKEASKTFETKRPLWFKEHQKLTSNEELTKQVNINGKTYWQLLEDYTVKSAYKAEALCRGNKRKCNLDRYQEVEEKSLDLSEFSKEKIVKRELDEEMLFESALNIINKD